MTGRVHLQLAPGERPSEGTLDAAARILEDPNVAAVLVPIEPEGASRTAAAARAYMAAWDARLIHDQTCFAPGDRVATREALPGPRAADAAPFLRRALDEGLRVVALREGVVRSPIAASLDAWVAWARGEGEAWGALARRDAGFARFAPAGSWPGWARHNVWHAWRRAGEVAQAMRRVDVEALWLHGLREAAWGAAFLAARPPRRS